MKYDVVHFKEPIPFDVMNEAEKEAMECDLMLICGTSAVVRAVWRLYRMAYVEAPYPMGVVVVYSSPAMVALMVVPSATSAPFSFTVPAK